MLIYPQGGGTGGALEGPVRILQTKCPRKAVEGSPHQPPFSLSSLILGRRWRVQLCQYGNIALVFPAFCHT